MLTQKEVEAFQKLVRQKTDEDTSSKILTELTNNVLVLRPFKKGEFEVALRLVLEKEYGVHLTNTEAEKAADNFNLLLSSIGLVW